MWYCRCGFGHHATGGEHTDLYFVPEEHCYVTEVASGQHPDTDKIGRLYFKLLAVSLVLGEESEHTVAKTVDGDATSALESLFHEAWTACPKGTYYTPDDTTRRQKAVLIRHHTSREQKLSNFFELRSATQKYTGETLLLSKRHDTTRQVQKFVTDFQREVLGSSRSTITSCDSDEATAGRALQKRKSMIREAESKFWSDAVSQNFNTKACLATKVDTMDIDDETSCKWISLHPFPLFVYPEKMEQFEDLLVRCENTIKEGTKDTSNDLRPICDCCQSDITTVEEDVDVNAFMSCGGHKRPCKCTRIICTQCIDTSNSAVWFTDKDDDLYFCSTCKVTVTDDDVIMGTNLVTEQDNDL
jgi:hypothetical protein